jgi:predicted NUDIX family NTP pyrophosphohydrolase
MQVSAGCVVRLQDRELGTLFLIVHPGGPYNRNAPWSIPKGEFPRAADPVPHALREVQEETGLIVRVLRPLGECAYKSRRKRVIAYLAEIVSGAEELWRTAHGYAIPGEKLQWEVDAAEFLPPAEARARLKEEQRVFIDRALEEPPG